MKDQEPRTGPRPHTCILGIFMVSSALVQAQLSVAPQGDLQALVQAIAGPGVQVANPVLDCHVQGNGTFSYTGGLLNAQEGVLLTSGSISNALGPNNSENRTFEQFHPGSALLTIMTGRTTYDACHLEFDLIPAGDSIRFNYVFASEEYPEWVGSQYNDVFGIFISGPGITGDPGLGDDRNIALVPTTGEPVMINTVNAGSNTAFFQDNTGSSQIQYDGSTRQLRAESAVQPCETYRLKLVIADVSDRLYDSGLFIGPIRSNAVTMSQFTASGLPYIVEGCNPGTLRFSNDVVVAAPMPVSFQLGGTAINGTDYSLIGANADPATTHTVTIPSGQDHVDVIFNAIADGLGEGQETIRVYLGSASCPGLRLDSIDMVVQDQLQLTVNGPIAICSGTSQDLLATGALSYNWTPSAGLNNAGIASPTASPSFTTIYTVTGTAGSCSSAASTTVTVSNMVLNAVITRPLCQGQSNGIVNLAVIGGVAPFSYSWTGPNGFSAATEDLVNVPVGTYSVTVTDGTGCTRVQSFNVTSPAQLTIALAPTILPFGQNISCHNGADGAIGLTVNGGTAPYTVIWSGPNGFSSGQQDITGLSSGAYTVTVTDQNGCSTGGSITLSQPPVLLPSIDDVTHVTCFGLANGTATASAMGGIPPYSFAWNTTPVQNTAVATELPGGTHTVTITDAYGCSSFTSITITEPTLLTVTLTNVGNVVHCQGQSQQQGTATAAPAGGIGPYSYHWNTAPAQTTASAIFNSGGNYTLTVTDANGCTATTSLYVDQPGSPTTSITEQTNVTCFGDNFGSATIAISGGGNIQSIVWNTEPPQTGSSVSNLPPGTWTATAFHANGCQTQVQVTIAGPAQPLLPVFAEGSVTPVSCTGGSTGTATVTATGGSAPYSYAWSSLPTQTTATATGLSAGEYSVQVSDANGCSATSSVMITEPAALVVSITGFTNVLCFETAQGSASALATGGTEPYSYSWNSSPAQSGSDASDLPAGNYTVTTTDANGCTATTTATIGGPQFGIFVLIEELGNETCFGASDGFATAGATGGSNSFTYTWNTTPPIVGPTATGLAPGNYLVEIVDNNGCDSPKLLSVPIIGPSAPIELMLAVTEASCINADNGAIDMTVSGGVEPYTYLWYDEDGNTTGTEDLTGLGPGTYFLTLYDQYGCMIDTTVTVIATNELQVLISVDQLPCQGASTGAMAAEPIAGVEPYSFVWTGPAGFTSNSPGIDGLVEGTYSVVIADGNGCTTTDMVELIGTAAATIDLAVSAYMGNVNVSCAGAADGSVDMTINGGTAPFAIAWTNGLGFNSIDEDISGLAPGLYQVTVADQNGCITMGQALLTPPLPIELDATLSLYNGNNVSCSGASDGNITLTVTGGTAPYVYSWTTGSNNADPGPLEAGAYSVIVTDANGCFAQNTWALTAPDELTVDLTISVKPGGTGVSCAGDDDGEIVATIGGGSAPYTIVWSGPGGFTSDQATINGLFAGSYTITVTDGNGCLVQAQVLLNSPTVMNASLSSTTYNGGYNIGCVGSATGNINMLITGGTPAYELSWTGPGGFVSNDASLNGLTAGIYQVTVTDAFGCTTSNTIELTEPSPLDIQTTISDAGFGYQVGCEGNDGSVATSISGGTPEYQLSWTGPSGFGSTAQALSGLASGNYQLTVVDANGCLVITNVLLTEPTPIGAAINAVPGTCPGDASGSFTVNVSGGTAPHTFVWNGPNGYTSNDQAPTDLEQGAYQLAITDAMGCSAIINTLLPGQAPLTSGTYVSLYGGFNLQCLGDSSGVIELDPQGGTAPYTTALNGPEGYYSQDLQHAGLIAGGYQLSIIDANGCSLDTVITLVAPEQNIGISLDLSVYPSGTNISCFEGSDGWIEVTVSGGTGLFTFVWRGPDSLEFNTPNIYGLPTGEYTYELVVTDANGCSLTTEVMLTQPDTALSAGTTLSTYDGGYNLTCNNSVDGSIDLAVSGGSGGYQFDWIGPGEFSSTAEDLDALAAGPYTVTITDMNGCELQETILLTAPAALELELLPFTHPGGSTISCHGAEDGSITATFGGGILDYSLLWTGPGGPLSSEPFINDLAPGTYCLLLTDANGCSTESCTTIEEPEVLSILPTVTDAPCGASTGSIQLEVVGGTGPHSFAWSTGDEGPQLNGLPPGTYSVIVTDANGCSSSITSAIDGSPTMELDANVTDVLCHGNADGQLELTINGGASPLDVLWSTGSTDLELGALTAGTYSVTVTDATGCTAVGTWQVAEPQPLALLAVPNTYWNGHNVSIYQGNDGSISSTVSGGTDPYSYDWSNGSSTASISGLQAGIYTVVVTDANGCTALATVELDEPNDLAMPTGFSPNGDGANDNFVIQGLDMYPANTFAVINRWGNVVYDRLNYRNDWNGENTQGQPLPNGTYFVILNVEDGSRTLQGYVDLRR